MKCETCGGEQSNVVQTVTRQDSITRLRECTGCKKRWRTSEAATVFFNRAEAIKAAFGAMCSHLFPGPRLVTPRERLHGPTTVYRHFDASGTLLYVGIACRIQRRTAQHRRGSPWFARVARTELVVFDSRLEALQEERRAISEELPLFNVSGRIA